MGEVPLYAALCALGPVQFLKCGATRNMAYHVHAALASTGPLPPRLPPPAISDSQGHILALTIWSSILESQELAAALLSLLRL